MSDPEDMWRVMYACVALHNFIRITDNTVDVLWEQMVHQEMEEAEARAVEQQQPQEGDEDEGLEHENGIAAELLGGRHPNPTIWRDRLAHAMFDDYQAYLLANHLN